MDSEGLPVTLYQGDCVEVLSRLPPLSVDLVFADPPFNIGYEYDEYDDRKTPEEYAAWCERWLVRCGRVLTQRGSLVIAIGEEYAAEMKLLAEAVAAVKRRQTIQWVYNFGVHCEGRFGRNHTTIYQFTKSKQHTFNADSIRVPSLRQTKYKDKRAVAKGRVPGNVWEVPRVCGSFKERCGWHKAQMPEEVLDRIVLAFSNPGDTVLDPFAGSGTTLAVAAARSRRAIGVELSSAYCDGIRNRIGRERVEWIAPSSSAAPVTSGSGGAGSG